MEVFCGYVIFNRFDDRSVTISVELGRVLVMVMIMIMEARVVVCV